MENIVLTVHLLLALALIALVLLQRSEGGGLGIGGGGGGGVMTGRQAANALTRVTWILAVAFLATSVTLTIIAARDVSRGSVLDQLDLGNPTMPAPSSGMPDMPAYVPPPPAAGQPITPPSASAPADEATQAAPAEAAPEQAAPVTPPAAAAPRDEPADPAPAQPAGN